MNAAKAKQLLSQVAALLRGMQAKINRLDGNLVEQDIAARRLEAQTGYQFANRVDRIEAALRSVGSNLNIDQWCKQNCGVDIRTMRRRKRLYRKWQEYLTKRHELGACGQTGLLFALSLIQDEPTTIRTTGLDVSVRSVSVTGLVQAVDLSRCHFITGDALTELPKLQARSVNVVLTSPPYWPSRRTYGGKGIGFEKLLAQYIDNLVAAFRESRRVLRDDGILWVTIDDSYGEDGNIRFIPARLAVAMVNDGWVCRAEIIWSKRGGGRPESVNNRPTKDHEKVLMFAKRRNGYHYNGDPIRVPLIRPYSTVGQKKPGIYRRDFQKAEKVWNNPMGRNSGSVWEITPANYRGSHAATMPPELVRRCLLVSCPDDGLVLDCFGGAGTTALVALQLGHRAISIELNPAYTEEARRRISTELGDAGVESDTLAAD